MSHIYLCIGDIDFQISQRQLALIQEPSAQIPKTFNQHRIAEKTQPYYKVLFRYICLNIAKFIAYVLLKTSKLSFQQNASLFFENHSIFVYIFLVIFRQALHQLFSPQSTSLWQRSFCGVTGSLIHLVHCLITFLDAG